MSRPGIEPRPPAWEASTLEKNQSNSLLMIIRNFYIRARESPTKPFFGLKYLDSLMQIQEKFGSGMEKTRIRDVYPGSATLDLTGISLCSVYILQLSGWRVRGIRMLGSQKR
jgi:hypothetical protein